MRRERSIIQICDRIVLIRNTSRSDVERGVDESWVAYQRRRGRRRCGSLSRPTALARLTFGGMMGKPCKDVGEPGARVDVGKATRLSQRASDALLPRIPRKSSCGGRPPRSARFAALFDKQTLPSSRNRVKGCSTRSLSRSQQTTRPIRAHRYGNVAALSPLTLEIPEASLFECRDCRAGKAGVRKELTVIVGMSVTTFTLPHVLISLVAGAAAPGEMIAGRRLGLWNTNSCLILPEAS